MFYFGRSLSFFSWILCVFFFFNFCFCFVHFGFFSFCCHFNAVLVRLRFTSTAKINHEKQKHRKMGRKRNKLLVIELFRSKQMCKTGACQRTVWYPNFVSLNKTNRYYRQCTHTQTIRTVIDAKNNYVKSKNSIE